ncbi:MAG TPA: helix-hairpin-helix domain-containing protein, partial [Thermodesulfobacteriota bacterium]|nr:helix-hairpin-helix domain-containing protein [Thermodesulfobacteriota bacterium]
MSKNGEIAEIFSHISDMLNVLGENPFKVRAYRNAAENILDLGEDIEDVAARGELTEIQGVGKDLSEKIDAYLKTGKIKEYEKLKEKVPLDLVDLLHIQGLGPKTLAIFFNEYGVRNLAQLEKVLSGDEILKHKGMGKKKIDDIKRGIEIFKESKERTLLGAAMPLAESIVGEIAKIPGTEGTILAGSLRRMRETIGDMDILTIADKTEAVVDAFTGMKSVKDVLASGGTKGSVILKQGMQADLRVVGPESYGAALMYFTGSKAHNVKLRTLATKKGLKINEYGVYKGEKI